MHQNTKASDFQERCLSWVKQTQCFKNVLDGIVKWFDRNAEERHFLSKRCVIGLSS